MKHGQNGMTQRQAANALAWLSEMGADEIVGEMAIDRFQISAPLPSSRRKPGSTVEPEQLPIIPARNEMDPGFRRDDGGLGALDDIIAALSVLDACPLKKTATNLCFAAGNPGAHVMLIGEAPGRDEDIQGKPFVGRSGQLLDRMLAAIGLSREAAEPERSVFITNTVFWRPPGNRTPTEAETAMCLPFLLRAIELLQPRIIVCLGATPAHRLTGRSEGILKMRGHWLQCTIAGRNIPLLPTLHPAYLLRQPGQKRLAWRDLLMLRQALNAS
jgi:DNA polymerase